MKHVMCALLALTLASLACVRNQPEIIVITATFEPPLNAATQFATPELGLAPVTLGPSPSVPLSAPTSDPTRSVDIPSEQQSYIVQPGDTLSGIAAANGISVESLLAVNALADPNNISVGQLITLPAAPDDKSPSFKIIPDSRLVRAPGSRNFDVAAFIAQQPGYIRTAADIVNEQTLTAAQIVQRVALEYSVDPRLLLALLEFRGGWLTNPTPAEPQQIYPLGAGASPLGFDRNGLYRQLTWGADQLNAGYYGWRIRGLTTLEFSDGTRLRFAPELNAGTVAVQYMLSQFNTYAAWQQQVSDRGLYAIYATYFGDPFSGAIEPLVPTSIQQPVMTLPFSPGETWFYTGGPHGGWGAGSAWAAVDFAPPDERTDGSAACYVSDFWATAVTPGIIARSGEGSVLLDLDGDGDEATGWTVLYLHMATEGRIAAGTQVDVGDRIGRPSCEGGFSNATHMHIARRFNGEWIPADCDFCTGATPRPPMVMSGWTIAGFTNQEYQGYMIKGSERRDAEQGRLTPVNRVSY